MRSSVKCPVCFKQQQAVNMATSVSVLCLNGRRQNVKVSPNTSILQILEEACSKQGYQASEHDLRHHRTTLDLSSTVRFSGLPNNCVLELVKRESSRTETAVTVAVQIESGERLTQVCQPSETLWELLSKCLSSSKSQSTMPPSHNPVCIYMRKEVVGEEALLSTTLRSLGLTGGKAVLRFLYRPVDATVGQAHSGSMILPHRDRSEPERSDLPRNNQSSTTTSSSQPVKTEPPVQITPSTNQVAASTDHMTKTSANQVVASTEGQSNNVARRGCFNEKQEDPVTSSVGAEGQGEEPMEVDGVSVSGGEPGTAAAKQRSQTDQGFRVVSLDENGTILFHLDDLCKQNEDLPDDFFEHTIEDVKYLMADLKRQRQRLEERPLITSALRQAQEDRRRPEHTHCVIRVQFPDRLVLQARFKSTDTVADLMDFINKHTEPDDYHLFTIPPKVILERAVSLLDAGVVPSAVVHYGTSTQKDHILLPSLIEKLATAAKLNSVSLRNSRSNSKVSRGGVSQMEAAQPSSTNEEAVRPNNPQIADRQPQAASSTEPSDDKKPKWFKLGVK